MAESVTGGLWGSSCTRCLLVSLASVQQDFAFAQKYACIVQLFPLGYQENVSFSRVSVKLAVSG